MSQDDIEALAAARAGDSKGYRSLMDRHSRTVFRLAYRMTGNEQDAEDVVQETFLRAFRQISHFDGRASFSTWVHCIAANYARDLLRAQKRRSEMSMTSDEGEDRANHIPTVDPNPERLAMSGQMRKILAPAMAQLSESERVAFVLRHYEGYSTDEIATALGVQPNAAKHSVFRAVQKLRRVLEVSLASVRPEES